MLRSTVLDKGFKFKAESWGEPPGMYGYSKLEWLPAEVPGHVHLDLVRNGVIADPFERVFELGARWVDNEDWVYKTEFEFAREGALPRQRLCFHGLDGVCSIALNGELIAEHDNMFVPLEVDVGAKLRAGANELVITFKSALGVGRERRARYFEAEGLKADTVQFDERAFVRKAQYMFGWDWGPRLVSCGIWGKLELVEYASRLLDVRVSQRHLEDGSVELGFASEIEGEGSALHSIEGIPGLFRDGEVARIAKPELWWPRGLGAQRLYRVTSYVVAEHGASLAEVEHVAHDRRETRIGLRRLRLVQRPDRFGESFEFECNGLPLWCVGANWIPDSSFPGALSRERVRAQVERAAALNMNMLRVWGGGLYESDDFYDACDELGILVWQDFPYACSFYPDGEAAQRVARDEARAALRRLRNRASLAIYCGNNENLTMFQDKWVDAARHPPRYYGEAIYDRVLPEVVAELDPERPYIPSSPFGGERANSGGVGDQHYWDVWHGRGDWKFYEDSGARFASEFGFASAPGRAAFERILPKIAEPLGLPVRELAARWHDKTKKGYETFLHYCELHYPASVSLEDWLYYSQLNQRDALRHGIEHYRRSEFCKGSLIWQLNDCWPVQSWAVIDSEFELKAAAYELERLYAPALASIELAASSAKVWAVLDNAHTSVSERLEVEVHSLLDGRCLLELSQAVELAPGERRVVLEQELAAFERESSILIVRFAGRTTFRLLAEPKQMRFGRARVRASLSGVELAIQSDLPLVDLFLWDEESKLSFSENFLTLRAGGEVRVLLSAAPRRLRARSLAGMHELGVTLR